MQDSTTKTCCTCNNDKLLGAFNRYTSAKDGLQPRCRECQASKRIETYAENREHHIARAKEWNRANPEAVRENDRIRRARDPERGRQLSRETYARHGKVYRARSRALRVSDPQTYREAERLWRAENKDSIADRKRSYRKSNPNVKRSERAKTYRRRAGTLGGPTGVEIQEKLDYHGNLCWICGDPANSVDHVKPLSRGGIHVLANLRPACVPCNSRKHAQWYGVRGIDALRSWVLLRLDGSP